MLANIYHISKTYHLSMCDLESEDGVLYPDDGYDRCIHCGSNDFYHDSVEWHSTCARCGIVASYDVGSSYVDYVKPKTYFKHNYFTNSILSSAMCRGFKITRVEMVEMERLYKLCVNSFNATKDKHKRKYFLNSNFVLNKIALHLGKDVSEYIKLPKKNTVERLEKDWLIVNPF